MARRDREIDDAFVEEALDDSARVWGPRPATPEEMAEFYDDQARSFDFLTQVDRAYSHNSRRLADACRDRARRLRGGDR